MSGIITGALGLVGAVVAWAIWCYNRLVTLDKRREEGWSGVLVQLKRRHDLVPNLVTVVKGYAAHEQGVFEDLTRMRAAAGGATPEQVSEQEQGFSRALGRLFAVAENYPDLKASQNFSELQGELASIENEIQISRRYFNGTVRDMNILVDSFPSLLIARRFGFTTSKFFELDSPTESAAPQVSF